MNSVYEARTKIRCPCSSYQLWQLINMLKFKASSRNVGLCLLNYCFYFEHKLATSFVVRRGGEIENTSRWVSLSDCQKELNKRQLFYQSGGGRCVLVSRITSRSALPTRIRRYAEKGRILLIIGQRITVEWQSHPVYLTLMKSDWEIFFVSILEEESFAKNKHNREIHPRWYFFCKRYRANQCNQQRFFGQDQDKRTIIL